MCTGGLLNIILHKNGVFGTIYIYIIAIWNTYSCVEDNSDGSHAELLRDVLMGARHCHGAAVERLLYSLQR